jgi:hypothetical protein
MMRAVDEPARPADEPSPGPLGPAPIAPPGPEPAAGPAATSGPVPPVGTPGRGLGAPPAPPPERTAWGARFAVAGLIAVGAIAGWFAATRFLPRWWAHRIGAIADGTFTAGIAAGLACGIAFTLLPLLVLRGSVRRRATWTARFAFLVLALLLAVPNLITLGVVLGTNNAAHAAERTFDVDAPGFRGATLAGAVLGGLLAISLWVLRWRAGHRRRRIADLEAQLAGREAKGHGPAAPSGVDADPK